MLQGLLIFTKGLISLRKLDEHLGLLPGAFGSFIQPESIRQLGNGLFERTVFH